MPTTPICNPHICRVLLGTAGYSGVLWGDVGFIGLFQKDAKKIISDTPRLSTSI